MAPKPAFAQNAQIEHPKFGCGTVVSCDDEYVVIHFDDHGQKKFISSIVVPNLKKIDRQPPNRSKSRRPKTKKAAGSAE